MVTFGALYHSTKKALKEAGIDNYQSEASYLIEKATGLKKHDIIIKSAEICEAIQAEYVYNYLERRFCGEPLQYILGEWEFYGINFKIGYGVLIPRQDTEVLVDAVIQNFVGSDIECPLIADLCSGSGCIAVTLNKMLESSKLFAVEYSKKAVAYLSANISDNDSDVEIIIGDVLDLKTVSNLPLLDCIVCNPPYLTKIDMTQLQKEVSAEPEDALFGGEDGLDFYRRIPTIWGEKLNKGGFIAFEIGIGQENDVKALLENSGYENVEFMKDLRGIVRVVCATKI